MSRKQNSQEFNKLQLEWYKKLKDSGFNDIEQDEWYLNNPRGSGVQITEKMPTFYAESSSLYYRLAGFFLNDYKFTDDIDKKIWELHSIGTTLRAISSELKNLGLKRCSYSMVNKRINRLKELMYKMYKS